MVIAIDAGLWQHPVSQIYFQILNRIDGASRFHVAAALKSRPSGNLGNCSSEELVDALTNSLWMNIFRSHFGSSCHVGPSAHWSTVLYFLEHSATIL